MESISVDRLTDACLAISKAVTPTAEEIHMFTATSNDVPHVLTSLEAKLEKTGRSTTRLRHHLEEEPTIFTTHEFDILTVSLVETHLAIKQLREYVGSVQTGTITSRQAKNSWNESFLKEIETRLTTQANAQQQLISIASLPLSERSQARINGQARSALSEAQQSASMYSGRVDPSISPVTTIEDRFAINQSYRDDLAHSTAYRNAFMSMMTQAPLDLPIRMTSSPTSSLRTSMPSILSELQEKAQVTLSEDPDRRPSLKPHRESAKWDIIAQTPVPTSRQTIVIEDSASTTSEDDISDIIRPRGHPSAGVQKLLSQKLGAVAYIGDESKVRTFLEGGADINYQDDLQQTALYRAVKGRRVKIVRLLTRNNAKLDLADEKGVRPFDVALDGALQDGSVELLVLLIQAGANVNDAGKGSRKLPVAIALETVAKSKSTKVVELLLSNGAKLVGDTREGSESVLATAVSLSGTIQKGMSQYLYRPRSASQSQQNFGTKFVTLLLEHGAHPEGNPGHDGLTPLSNAVKIAQETSCLDLVRLLLRHGANPNVWAVNSFILPNTSRRRTILEEAADMCLCTRSGELLRLLLEHGADINASDPDYVFGKAFELKKARRHNSGLTWSIGFSVTRRMRYDGREMLKLLLKHGGDANTLGENGVTLLMRAIKDDDDTLVLGMLLVRGADIDAQDYDGNTALHCAVTKGRQNSLRLLLSKGASTELRNDMDATPLHLSSITGALWALRPLIDAGADLEARMDLRNDGLHKKQDIYQIGGAQATALHLATCQELTDVTKELEITYQLGPEIVCGPVRTLLDAGAYVDACGDGNVSPLYVAARYYHLSCRNRYTARYSPAITKSIIVTLINHGASIDRVEKLCSVRKKTFSPKVWTVLRAPPEALARDFDTLNEAAEAIKHSSAQTQVPGGTLNRISEKPLPLPQPRRRPGIRALVKVLSQPL